MTRNLDVMIAQLSHLASVRFLECNHSAPRYYAPWLSKSHRVSVRFLECNVATATTRSPAGVVSHRVSVRFLECNED